MQGHCGRSSEGLRALRRPLVALCAVLVLANLLIPAAILSPGPAFAGSMCLPTGVAQPDEGGSAPIHPFATCCVSAAMALLPAPLAVPASREAAAAGPIAIFADTRRAARRVGAGSIRGPPDS